VPLLAAALHRRDEIRGLEDVEVLGHRLARHVEVCGELRQRLPVAPVQPVEELAPRRVRERSREGFLQGVSRRSAASPASAVIEPPGIAHPSKKSPKIF